MYKKFGKRSLDIALSFAGIVLLLPVFLLIFLIIRFKTGNDPLFRQPRPGLNERIFVLYKFKTMTDQKDETGNLLSDKERLTQIGSFLRKTSLDEIPQLWNVLKGDMSLVGPRPLLVEYLPRYSSVEKLRHSVKPGITGYAQINGRNSISWQEKFKFDLWYVEHLSFSTDLKIIFRTLSKIFRRDQVNSAEGIPMEKFMG